MGTHIEQIDASTAPDSLLVGLATLYDVVDAEELPGDPPTPVEKRIADWRISFARFPINRWILRAEGEIVAAAVTHYDVEENLENGMGRVAVHPGRRGRGYARMVATPMLDHLEENGRTRFETWIKKDAPAEKLAEKVGLRSVLSERRSRLVVAEVDVDLMQTWIDRASERAAEYELIYMSSPFPEENLERFCDMMFIMNSAPLEDYEMDEEHISPENWRDIESSVLKAQNQIHNLTAVHQPTGQFVGYTQIKTQALQPDLAWQWDTGVHPDHRNKGLGRWLKAAMLEKIVSEHPEVERIDTENAGSNEPMLNINTAMGFKPIHDANAWQGELATVRERFRA
jgi:GNAT superfamily N-acetyltransferase